MTKSYALILAAAIAATGQVAHGKTEGKASEYRPGVTVEHVYTQDIEYYFTNWFGRVEASDGPWRDIYFETAEKYVNKGTMRINCADPEADIGFTLYDIGEEDGDLLALTLEGVTAGQDLLGEVARRIGMRRRQGWGIARACTQSDQIAGPEIAPPTA